MKKTLTTLALAAMASSVFAQGFVLYGNGNSSRVSTNAVVGGASAGLMMANNGTLASTYYFALFYSASATTINGFGTSPVLGNTNSQAYAVNDANWTFLNPTAGQAGSYVYGAGYGTNTASAALFQSDYIDPTQNGTLVPFTSAAQFVVIGWSANIGNTIGALQSYLANPTLTGWVGESIVTGPITPGNPNGSPPSVPASLFGSTSTSGVMHGFMLGEVVPVPEPATMALAGLGGLSLLLFRRRS